MTTLSERTATAPDMAHDLAVIVLELAGIENPPLEMRVGFGTVVLHYASRKDFDQAVNRLHLTEANSYRVADHIHSHRLGTWAGINVDVVIVDRDSSLLADLTQLVPADRVGAIRSNGDTFFTVIEGRTDGYHFGHDITGFVSLKEAIGYAERNGWTVTRLRGDR